MSSDGSLSLEKFARLIGIACLLAACGPTPGRAETIAFAESKRLGDFEFTATGKPGEWSVVRNEAVQVLARTSTDATDDRFPLGKRQMIAGVDANVSSRTWHTLGIAARDDRFIILFDGRELFGATDATLPGPGRIGLWTKADSITWFESITVKSLD